MATGRTWWERLWSQERRGAKRQMALPLSAFYWDGGNPAPRQVRDISPEGMYLYTDQRWYLNTLLTMTLTRNDKRHSDPDRSIRVTARVVRSGNDGVGLAFVLTEGKPREVGTFDPQTDRVALMQFLTKLKAGVGRDLSRLISLDSAEDRGRSRDRGLAVALPAADAADENGLGNSMTRGLSETEGQSQIEFILCLPMILLLVVNLVNFGGFFYAWITVANAARAGADYAIMGGASVGAPGAPTATQVTSLITSDISSLPNSSSLSVDICQNNNGTVTTLHGTCSSIPADPEAGSYVLTTVDVTYTYVPFIRAFSFPKLGVYLTLPPTTVYQRADMRSIQ